MTAPVTGLAGLSRQELAEATAQLVAGLGPNRITDPLALAEAQFAMPPGSAEDLLGHWSVRRGDPHPERPPAQVAFAEHAATCALCRYLESVQAIGMSVDYQRCASCGGDIDAHDVGPDQFGLAHAWCRTHRRTARPLDGRRRPHVDPAASAYLDDPRVVLHDDGTATIPDPGGYPGEPSGDWLVEHGPYGGFVLRNDGGGQGYVTDEGDRYHQRPKVFDTCDAAIAYVIGAPLWCLETRMIHAAVVNNGYLPALVDETPGEAAAIDNLTRDGVDVFVPWASNGTLTGYILTATGQELAQAIDGCQSDAEIQQLLTDRGVYTVGPGAGGM
jgi:hypothetical protein